MLLPLSGPIVHAVVHRRTCWCDQWRQIDKFYLVGLHLCNVDMEVADRVLLELLTRLVTFNIRQPRYAVPLQAANVGLTVRSGMLACRAKRH